MPRRSTPRFAPHHIDREAAERALDAARDAGADLDARASRELAATLGASAPGVLPSLLRIPSLLARMADEFERRGAVAPARVDPAPGPLDDDVDVASRALRRDRDEALVRTTLRELLAAADVDATAREWSSVADACVSRALSVAAGLCARRDGPPRDGRGDPCGVVALGMGKLGGEELNLGSDVDLCLFYATDGGAAGARTLEEHFARVGRLVVELLGAVTADGFAFRVDLRLRPEGSRGPVACSLASAERYYETWGRPWERLALVRARPVAGDLGLGRALLDALRPFVYRRAVEPAVVREVSAMLARARRELLRDDARDLKLGAGGIREAEFAVQALQLVWGGARPALQVAGTLEAVRRLRAASLLSHREARAFEDAWATLRRAEHRVQSMAGYATHELPSDPRRMEVLARSLGHPDAASLVATLDRARRVVRALFASVQPDGPRPVDDPPELALARAVADGDVAPEACVEALGVRDGEAAAEHLRRLARRADLPLAPGNVQRDPAVASLLLRELRDAADPDAALRLASTFFERLRPAQAYARALAERPARARALLGLFGASEHLAQALLARPARVDLVVDAVDAPDVDAIAAGIVAAAAPRDDGDTERSLAALRAATVEAVLAVGLADLGGRLDTLEVTARLGAAAEGAVRASLALAVEECRARWAPTHGGHGLVVVALGSLAAGELGYNGDIDLVFLHGGDGETAGEWAARVAQRTLSLLGMPHEEGGAWRTDTRLRPSGSQGTLVSSFEAFARYHADGARPWERQALVRARPVAGDDDARREAERLLASIAWRGPHGDLDELRRLRARMELELGREDRGEVALKFGRGGLVDVEFAAQALQMRHGAHDPSLRCANTRAALDALRRAGHLDDATHRDLAEGERLLRAVLLAARLTTGRAALRPAEPSAVTVARRMGYRDRATSSALEALLADLASVRGVVRGAFLRALGRA